MLVHVAIGVPVFTCALLLLRVFWRLWSCTHVALLLRGQLQSCTSNQLRAAISFFNCSWIGWYSQAALKQIHTHITIASKLWHKKVIKCANFGKSFSNSKVYCLLPADGFNWNLRVINWHGFLWLQADAFSSKLCSIFPMKALWNSIKNWILSIKSKFPWNYQMTKIEFEFCQSWFFIDFGKSIFDVYLLEALRQNDFIAFCVSSEVLLCKVCKEGF